MISAYLKPITKPTFIAPGQCPDGDKCLLLNNDRAGLKFGQKIAGEPTPRLAGNNVGAGLGRHLNMIA